MRPTAPRTCAYAAALLAGACLFFPGCGEGGRREEALPSSDPHEEYIGMRAVNAVLRARLSLSKQDDTYLILDLPDREIRLELQGVTLTKVPIRKPRLNRLAREISRDTTRIGFCEIPFDLQKERWIEDIPTLAHKDSAAVRTAPDTTGHLAMQVRTARVLGILHFDRNLVVALDGRIPPATFKDRWKGWMRAVRGWLRADSMERTLAREGRRSVFLRIEMAPSDARSLAPSLREGTKLVLRF